jgi:hypothetical protein
VISATAGWFDAAAPGVRGTEKRTPSRTLLSDTAAFRATADTTSSPVSTLAAVPGLVAGVCTGTPEMVVGWPSATRAVELYSVRVAKVSSSPSTAAAAAVARISQRPLHSTRP